MKAALSDDPTVFKPITLTITAETIDEARILAKLWGRNVDVARVLTRNGVSPLPNHISDVQVADLLTKAFFPLQEELARRRLIGEPK